VTRRCKQMLQGAGRGQIMPFFALILVVLMGAAALGIDLSRVRAEAENAQRAANAAALAGVIYLPDFKDSAYTRATEESRKNGYVTGQKGVTVTPSTMPGYGGRLQVTVNEPAPSIFGHALGILPQTISRSATAEYDLPLQLGAPDWVLGYAPFPTKLVSSAGAYQGFYLAQRGRYDSKELGDALSPYYQSFAGNGFGQGWEKPGPSSNSSTMTSPPANTNHCNPVDKCPGLTQNSDRPTNFKGYDYVVDDPLPNTLVIKLFDPFDENDLDNWCGQWAQDSYGKWYCAKPVKKHPSGQLLAQPYNSPSDNKLIDGGGSNAFGSHTTTLEFTLSGPYQTPYDTSDKPIKTTPGTLASGQSCTGVAGTTAVNCVISWPFNAGQDPAYLDCISSTSRHDTCDQSYSPYAFRFVNYAIIHGPGIFHLHSNSVQNSDGTEGTHLNEFGIGVCGDSKPGLGTAANPSGSDVSNPAHPYANDPGGDTAVNPPAGSPAGTPRTWNDAGNHYPYTSDPDPAGPSTWNPDSCPSPNDPSICPDPGTAGPGKCVHIYAFDRMAIHNQLSNGKSLIPLGYVPTEYEGKTLQVHLFDVGDTTITTPPDNTIEVLTPVGDLSHYDNALNLGFPSSLDYTYKADSDPGSGFVVATETPKQSNASQALDVSAPEPATSHFSWGRYNGSWLTINVPIDLSSYNKKYYDMVNGTGAGSGSTPAFGGYWKILYDAKGLATDTTTWEVAVNGAPVHLISAG